MVVLTTQAFRILQVLVASTIILTLFFTAGHFGSNAFRNSKLAEHVSIPESLSGGSTASFMSKAPVPKPANETLDFQEIIYLSMPYRTDRQDALSLIAAVTGLKLTMLPGVSADEVHVKAQPGGSAGLTGLPALGVWRAHANAWRYIIDNNIQSALILEDDVDWDVNIKQIMGAFNWQLKYNNTIRWGAENVRKGWSEDCPYGCDWDELFVGQCGGGVHDDRVHQIFKEENSPKMDTLPEWAQEELQNKWNVTESENIRLIAPTYEPICLMGYAVSHMGALRMLYNIGGWREASGPVDNEIAARTREGVMSGYTLSPPVITSWRVGGSQDSDNDSDSDKKATNGRAPLYGISKGLKNSVRRYLETYFKKNYWEDYRNGIRQ